VIEYVLNFRSIRYYSEECLLASAAERIVIAYFEFFLLGYRLHIFL